MWPPDASAGAVIDWEQLRRRGGQRRVPAGFFVAAGRLQLITGHGRPHRHALRVTCRHHVAHAGWRRRPHHGVYRAQHGSRGTCMPACRRAERHGGSAARCW